MSSGWWDPPEADRDRDERWWTSDWVVAPTYLLLIAMAVYLGLWVGGCA